MEVNKKEKEGWYPGKYMQRASKRRSVETNQSLSIDDHDTSTARKINPNVSADGKDSSANYVPDLNLSSTHLTSAEIMGALRIQVLDIKYLRLSSAKLSIQVDKVVSQYVAEGSKLIDRNFDLYDVTSDIKISVVGRSDAGELLCGIVVIPVTSLLGFTGKPNPPKEQWRQFFPVCLSRISDGRAFKFSSGYSDLPGYALNRKEALGFINLKIELTLHDHPFHVYMSKGSTSWRKQLSGFSWFDMDGSETPSVATPLISNAELTAMINRDMNRIWSQFRLPLSLSAVCSLPEVLVINMLFGCMCFVVDTWQLPFILVSFCALTGFLSTTQRSFVNTTIWNEPLPLTLTGTPADPNHSNNLPTAMDPTLFMAGAVPSSLNAYPAAAAAAAALMPSSADLLGGDGEASGIPVGAGSIASGAGAASVGGGGGGSASAAPPTAGARISVASSVTSGDRDYEVSAKPSVLRLLQTQNLSLARVARSLSSAAHALEVASNLLSFADPRASIIAYLVLFSLASVLSLGLLIAPRMSSFAVVSFVTLSCASGAFVLDMVEAKAGNKRAAGADHMEAVSHSLDCLAGFLARVPDELELIHRHIAAASVVNGKGSEMQDAAATFDKRASLR